jgi:hypothetical protein
MSRQRSDEAIKDYSEALENSMGFSTTSVLLRAFAIENLLKGLLVQADPKQWVPRPASANKSLYPSWGRKGHKLTDLAAAAGIELSDEEVRVCRQLVLYLEWGGRYPTAPRPSNHGPDGATWHSVDDEVVERIYTRLRVRLRDAIGLRED